MPESGKKKNKDKQSPLRRAVTWIKKLLCRVCRRARWFVIAGVLAFISEYFLLSMETIKPYTYGVRDSSNKFIPEMPLESAAEFSAAGEGKAAFLCRTDNLSVTSFMDISTGESTFSNLSTVLDKNTGTEGFFPYNFALTDGGELYAVRKISRNTSTEVILEESIVRISDKNEYLGEVCRIKYENERIRHSKISRLHYYNGEVTFAAADRNGVKLYSVDTGTRIVKESRLYPPDPDGTYTAAVIPIDGAFLFVRSDGNVCQTAFDEPVGGSIFRFGNGAGKYFTQAAVLGGKLYVCGDNDPGRVYLLENGALTEAVDLSSADGGGHRIVSLAVYRPKGAREDVLAVCLDSGLYTYTPQGGAPARENIVIVPDSSILLKLTDMMELIIDICFIGIVINLVIRKKTLFYKQLIVVVPVFIVISGAAAVLLFRYSDSASADNMSKELEMVCGLSAAGFDGYDFSGVLETNGNTGAAYMEICDKLDGLSRADSRDWSEQYTFSILRRTDEDDTHAAVIARDDMLSIPLCDVEETVSEKEILSQGNTYVSKSGLSGYFDDYLDDRADSTIYALCRIADKGGTGIYYFKVSTDSNELFTRRRTILGLVSFFVPVIFLIIVGIIAGASMRITRTIRKATAAVEKIAGGDLSARIQYKSRDELGEICSQVNKMGQSLETLFREKSRAELFYYKFVPEKFREFLGKESFTDLALGDASSRELTVLFCDIRSFSINSEMMTAKENFAFVNVIYGKAGPIIRGNGGFVDKYIGDAVMALFENADDAVRCGIELYRSIVLDPATARELNVSDINIGIGIHTGMAMIGIVGESERLSGTVISDTVNLSSRLESLTKKYKTALMISKDTADRLSDPDMIGTRYLGMIQVAGVNEVRAVYEVLDCLPEEKRRRRSENSAELREAIRLFHLGRRQEAAAALKALSDSGRGDEVTEMYLSYITSLSDSDKGNVFRFESK